ncbi:hypothetical protein MN608_10420 [Microdochium nivale]|nr:hypothetical protein MN608_10420 [Microdochium nivale]
MKLICIISQLYLASVVLALPASDADLRQNETVASLTTRDVNLAALVESITPDSWSGATASSAIFDTMRLIVRKKATLTPTVKAALASHISTNRKASEGIDTSIRTMERRIRARSGRGETKFIDERDITFLTNVASYADPIPSRCQFAFTNTKRRLRPVLLKCASVDMNAGARRCWRWWSISGGTWPPRSLTLITAIACGSSG